MMLTGEPEPSPVCWRASDDPNGTSLRAETWAGAAGERSWENVGPQLEPWRGWRLCARWRAWLRFLCDRSCGGNDSVEEISKPVATGLADVSTTRRVSMEKKSSTDDQLMNLEVLHPNAAGIDIGNAAHYVAVPPDRDTEPVRTFACFTQDVRAIADWLKQCGIVTVAMQSTGVYFALSSALIGRVQVPPALR